MNDSKPFRPFPQIPRYPGEAAKGNLPAEPEDPPLEGPPQSEEESIFSRPGFVEAITLLDQYNSVNVGRQRSMVQGEVRQAAIEPERLIRICDSLALIAEMTQASVEEGRIEAAEQSRYRGALELAQAVREGLDKTRLRAAPSADAFGEWVRLSSREGEYSADARRMLRMLIERAGSPRAITDVMYNIADGALFDSDAEVSRQALRLLIGDTDMMSHDSKQFLDSILAEYDLNDEVLKKIMEVGAAVEGIIANRFPELAARRAQLITEAVRNPESTQKLARHLRDLQGRDPDRYKDLQLHHTMLDTSDDGVVLVDHEQVHYPEFLQELVRHPGSVRQKLNDIIEGNYESDEGTIIFNVVLPGVECVQGFDDQVDVNQYILRQLRQPNTTGEVFSDKRRWKTLSHLFPAEFADGWPIVLARVNKRLIDDMRDNSHYLLSPRGDQVEVTNGLFRDLGFESVLYEMDPRNRRDTIVTVRVGNFDYKLLLDENFAIYNVSSARPMILPPTSEFLNLVVLSHLREIRCSSSVNEATSGSSSGVGDRRAFTTRRAHRRRLPVGQRPTNDQIVRALEDYDIDLVRMNQDRAARRQRAQARGEEVDERWVTYVFPEQQVAIAGQGPVKSRTPEAGNQLQDLL